MALTRDGFISQIDSRLLALEIGPFTRPCLLGRNVKYFDILDKTALIERAKVHNFPRDNPVDIDYVSGVGDLSIVEDGKFDIVFSSHCIEHQPDLIRHLQHVSRILNANGKYYIIIPDKRYCFDHFYNASELAEVEQAYKEHRRVHTWENVLSLAKNAAHNDPVRHWAGDHGERAATPNKELEAVAAESQKSAPNEYIDTHAWRFTPETFGNIIQGLRHMTGLSPGIVYSTPVNTFEFCAILNKSSSGKDA